MKELDNAFNWAEKYGLKILIDLHTAPDSQNGFDNGGISGVCKWSQEPEEVEFELSVLERLAERYGTREGLWGIEVINEPILEDMWETMHVQERYPAVDPEKAAGSKPNTMEFIRQFYLDAYDRLRKYMPEDKYLVIHDAFRLKAWKDFMREDKYKNVVLDTHMYLMVAEKKAIYRAVADAQLAAWKKGSGYFYWTYKMLTDTVNTEGWVGWDCWDLGRCVDFGWFPTGE